MLRRVRITLSARQPLVLTGIRSALSPEEFELLGEARTVDDTLALIALVEPDVALVSVDLRGIEPLGLLDLIRRDHPTVKVMVLGKLRDPVHIQATFARGAWAYILDSIDLEDLGAAIRMGVHENAYHARGLPALEDATLEARAAGLTQRELTIVKALPRGLTNKEIAAELWLTEQTVKFHLTNIYRKIGASNRIEAMRWASDRGLV